jgi:DNA-binding transcriptional ArsR family regulator
MSLEEMPVEPTDVAAVRALAHPLRLRLLDLLRFDGPSTATVLARRVCESTGATSYHLRQLARHGFIEDAGPGRGRERWWRYKARRLALSGDAGPSERELLGEILSSEAHALDRFLAGHPRGPEWDDAAFFMSLALRLTAGELAGLRRRLEELCAPLRRADAEDAPPGARHVRMLAFAYPPVLEEE